MYIVFDDCGTDFFTKEFETKEAAIREAEKEWNRLTSNDKKRRVAFYVGFGTVDNHNIVKMWK